MMKQEKKGKYFEQNHFKIYNLDKETIDLNEVSIRNSLVVNNCNSVVINISKTINHIEINNSKHVHLKFKSVISSVELTRVESCTLESNNKFYTLQIDM